MLENKSQLVVLHDSLCQPMNFSTESYTVTVPLNDKDDHL